MADPSISSSPVTPIGKRWKRAFTLILAILGRILLIVGAILQAPRLSCHGCIFQRAIVMLGLRLTGWKSLTPIRGRSYS